MQTFNSTLLQNKPFEMQTKQTQKGNDKHLIQTIAVQLESMFFFTVSAGLKLSRLLGHNLQIIYWNSLVWYKARNSNISCVYAAFSIWKLSFFL